MMPNTNIHKQGIFAEPNLMQKTCASQNPEYMAAFRVFDVDHSNTIDISELHRALAAVKQNVESTTMRAGYANQGMPAMGMPAMGMGMPGMGMPAMGMMPMFQGGFSPNTVLRLAARFAVSGGGIIWFQQFAELMQYLENVKHIFQQIDTDHSGDLSISELSRGLSLSGFNVSGFPGGGDAISMTVAQKIGQAYDEDKNGVLTFDEFVQLRLEWDNYLDAWGANVPPMSTAIAPQQLIQVIEGIKRSLEPLSSVAMNPQFTNMQGYSAQGFLNSLFYSSMFSRNQPFHMLTVTTLIRKFGCGSPMMNFEQFCLMMEWLKEAKVKFSIADTDRSGGLDLSELHRAFAVSGMPMGMEALVEIGRRYDISQSGTLGFDEFVQMLVELEGIPPIF